MSGCATGPHVSGPIFLLVALKHPAVSGTPCSFRLVPEEWEEAHGRACPLDEEDFSGDAWHCPRAAVTDGRCAFHQRTDEKAAALSAERLEQLRNAVQGEPAADAFADAVDDREYRRRATELIGTRAPELRLDHAYLRGGDTQPLDLRCSEVATLAITESVVGRGLDCRGLSGDTVDLEGTTVHGSCRFDTSVVSDGLCLSGGSVTGTVSGRDGQFGRIDCATSTVGTHVDLREVTVRGDVTLRGGEIAGRLRMRYATIAGELDCQRTRFTGETAYKQIHQVSCKALDTDGQINFRGAIVDGAVRLNEATPSGDLTVADATLRSHLWIGAVDSENGRSGSAHVGGTIDLSGATVAGEVDLTGAGSGEYALAPPSVGGTVSLSGTTVEGPLYLAPDLSESPVDVVDLSRADLARGRVGQATSASPVLYDCTRASIGSVRFVDASGTPSLRHARLVDVRFEGFEFGWHREAIEAQGWKIHETDHAAPAAIARARNYAQSARYAQDALVMLTTYDSVHEYLCSRADALADDPPGTGGSGRSPDHHALDPDTVAEELFGPVSGLPDIEARTASELFPPPVAAREYTRIGLAGRLLLFHVNDIEHPVVDGLATPSVASALCHLAAVVEEQGTPVTIADIRDELDALAIAFAEHLGDVDGHKLTYPRLEATYLRARNGADAVGDATAAGEFYIKEMYYRRKQHRARIGNDGWLWPTYDWGSNCLLALSSVYGERPGRVMGIASGLIVGFAIVFAGLMRDQPYDQPFGYVILSLESFVTLVLGGAEDVPSGIRFIAQVEGFLGGFLIALFVFTLTRSLHR